MSHKISVMRDYAVQIVETGEIFYNGWALADEKNLKVNKLRKCLLDPFMSYEGLHFKLLDPKEAGF